MRHYPDEYVKQFDLITTCSGYLFKHENVMERPPTLEWYFGVYQKYIHIPDKKKLINTISYEELLKTNKPVKKKLISVVINEKSFTEGHVKRREFVLKLKQHFGDSLDILGRSFNYIHDKKDAILDYKYHIVIENSVFKHYWSEKLADAYLGWSYPIYYGCPNLSDYFDDKAYSLIDIDDIDYSIKVIELLISNNIYEKNNFYIEKARNDILNKYNMFEMMVDLLDDLDYSQQKKDFVIKSIQGINGKYSYLKLRARINARNIRNKLKKYFNLFL